MSSNPVVQTNFKWRLAEWFPKLDKAVLDQLFLFNQELHLHNDKTDLVSPKSLPHSDLVHFADSIISFESVLKKININEDLYDIGSGAGFPGLVIAIVHPQLKLTLVECDQSKCNFLRLVIKKLDLKNVIVSGVHAENLDDESVEQAVTRGYLPFSQSFLNLRPVFKKGGVLYSLKNDEWAQEVAKVPTQLCSVWRPTLFHEYKLPGVPSSLFVVASTKLT